MFETEVDLSVPPKERWRLTKAQRRAAKELLTYYKRDLGLDAEMSMLLLAVANQIFPDEYRLEIEGMSERTGIDFADGLLLNLYYDALKTIWGCTAFSLDTPTGSLHARNLDWWTDESLLSRTTQVSHFINGPAGDFYTVGWPGFVGALSGFAHERFAVSINSVLSDDSPEISLPVVSLLRRVLETCRSFDEAVAQLVRTEIASDAIVLVTGTKKAERVVIERTPTRHALRNTDGDALVAANDYLSIQHASSSVSGDLSESSCGRFDRATHLLMDATIRSPEDAVRILSDDQIRMKITAQQMAFDVNSGELYVQAGEERAHFYPSQRTEPTPAP